MNRPPDAKTVDGKMTPISLDDLLGPQFKTAEFTEEQRKEEEVSNAEMSILRSQMQPILRWLLKPEIEEIAINRPGEVWQRLRKARSPGEYWVPNEDPALTDVYLTRMCHLLANMQNIPSFGPNATPVVYGTLPGGHRFAGGLGGNIQYGKPDEGTVKGSICLCIRQFVREQKIELEHYGAERGKALRVSTPSIFTKQNDPDDPHAKIYNSLVRGDHILVSGPTGCGKTSFINRLIANISPHKRIVTVEDTRELIVPAPNRVHIVMSRTDQGNKFTYLDVRDLIVRMTPDIVLAGELSTTNAAVIWNLMTTGHGSFMTTIHAESVREAVGSFIRLVVISSASNAQIDQRALAEEMLSKLRIIQLKHDDVLGRHIEAIH